MDPVILILIGTVPLVLVGGIYIMVISMSAPEKMLQPLPDGLKGDHKQYIMDRRDWLSAHNLAYLTSYQFSMIDVAVFKHSDAQRFLSFHFHQTVTLEIESRFDDLTLLETSNIGSGAMFPTRPGAYRQVYPRASLDEIWQRHLEAEEYLVKKFGLKWEALSRPYEQVLVNSLRRSIAHIRSIPFWPFRALYWYAVRPRRLANRSVQQLHP